MVGLSFKIGMSGVVRRMIAALGFSAALIAFAAVAGEAGVIHGVVADDAGRPVAGVMVTATWRKERVGTTVYTGAGGDFRLPPLASGTYDIRARRIGYRDVFRQGVALRDGTQPLAFVMPVETDPHELAWQLPASRWLPLVLQRLSSDERREEFIRQCTYCHQQGNWATRVKRSPEDWEKIFKLMARLGGLISAELRRELTSAFNTAYDDANYLAALTQPAFTVPPPAAGTARAVVTEWDIGHPASMQHDLVVHPDGSVYSVDTSQDRLYRLDPRTNERKSWDIPRGDSPLGGVFSGTGALQAPNSNAHVGPHSLQVAPDGSIWMTLCLGNKMARFDPAAERWEIFEQESGVYPHTLRFDPQGRVWYTLAVSNHVGMIDPQTRKQRVVRLPARSWGEALAVRLVPAFLWLSRTFPVGDSSASAGEGVKLPIPYGIDIAPDGGVWFSQLNERRIGRIDPNTFAVKMIDTPFPGPRRLRFDSKGRLWIPGFSAGVLARFTPASGEFKEWKIPIEGVETPYALNVDRRTDAVWVCGTNSDTLIRFEPDSERFTVFPLPTRVTYTREIDFDVRGGVWTSNSNFPTWQIEGPGPKIIRLDPEGAAS